MSMHKEMRRLCGLIALVGAGAGLGCDDSEEPIAQEDNAAGGGGSAGAAGVAGSGGSAGASGEGGSAGSTGVAGEGGSGGQASGSFGSAFFHDDNSKCGMAGSAGAAGAIVDGSIDEEQTIIEGADIV